jgi:reactive intermediate/imine deaminase|tara:strand:+ start:2607 stop:2987 length:381 start_codon:yes stop_codon:yes gene_type:complete
MKKEIKTANAPEAIGPYSQGIETENLIFLSGQIPLDPKSMQLVEGQENQIRQVFKNIDALCKETGLSLNHVVKLNVSLQDLALFQSVNEIMKELFVEPYPARAALQVARLPLDSSIEVEAILAKTI